MAFSFKLPKLDHSKKKQGPTEQDLEMTVSSVMPSPIPIAISSSKQRRRSVGGSSLPAIPLPRTFMAKPIEEQMKILGGIFVFLLFVAIVLVMNDNRKTNHGTAYLTAAGEMRMLSQRLSKASSLAVQGNAVAFGQLKDSRERFSELLTRLRDGGIIADTNVPASPSGVENELKALIALWGVTDKNAEALVGQEETLISLGQNVATIDAKNPLMLELSEQVAALKLQNNASAREIVAANQLVMLTQRIGKNAAFIQAGEVLQPEVAVLLGKDTNSFRDNLGNLVRATADAETRAKLAELEGAFKDYAAAIGNILSNIQPLMVAKLSGARIFKDSEALLKATDEVASAYQRLVSARVSYMIMLIVTTLLAIGTLGILAKLYLDDMRRRADDAERQRLESETANRENQDAILRLMNELGDLADGDLTVTATVSENITGAIADSINYTIEELRVLVGRINDAASRVTLATEIARKTSAELIEAAAKQSTEIQEAGRSALAMAGSMTQVSGDANQSAQVARQSLAAAEKGTIAVQDSIKGMNEIRGQIQETSKRIKRLGESSQEIGEIVELISDITEQTNVLALNAAIQAASAGDAGRGFTVVAEEVQRLAERSAEATKQIAAIVKTIQTDTQDAVSAMEESTQGVVEGAKLSDAAGQALAEIGDVSRNLANLIEDISSSTRQQADSAANVAQRMQEILHITDQTSAGTQRTAEAVEELNSLAAELKGSVAGFKVG